MNNFLLKIVKKITSCLAPAQKANVILVYKGNTMQTKKITVATIVINHKNDLPVKKEVMPGIMTFLFFKRKQKISTKIIPFNSIIPVPAYPVTATNPTAKK